MYSEYCSVRQPTIELKDLDKGIYTLMIDPYWRKNSSQTLTVTIWQENNMDFNIIKTHVGYELLAKHLKTMAKDFKAIDAEERDYQNKIFRASSMNPTRCLLGYIIT